MEFHCNLLNQHINESSRLMNRLVETRIQTRVVPSIPFDPLDWILEPFDGPINQTVCETHVTAGL